MVVQFVTLYSYLKVRIGSLYGATCACIGTTYDTMFCEIVTLRSFFSCLWHSMLIEINGGFCLKLLFVLILLLVTC